ncbi:hypothetical protein BC830DRAFT_1071655 [Chytriomyces sp. MP71]|nr:hypothetical protein BC830DRAFT_1071655 [Chytriomyces sp. MP71]
MGADLPSECAKAAGIIAQFLQPSAIDQLIPADVIARAQGVAVLKVTRLGLHLSGRYGTGVLVARLPDGTWSAPSVIKTAGVGVGFVIGAEVTDAVLILNSAKAVASFTQENVTLGGNLSVAAGPVGRSAEGAVSILNPAPVYSYSKTKGLYAGASLEGSAIIEGKSENARFYGRPVSVREILSGVIPRPQAAAPLYA